MASHRPSKVDRHSLPDGSPPIVDGLPGRGAGSGQEPTAAMQDVLAFSGSPGWLQSRSRDVATFLAQRGKELGVPLPSGQIVKAALQLAQAFAEAAAARGAPQDGEILDDDDPRAVVRRAWAHVRMEIEPYGALFRDHVHAQRQAPGGAGAVLPGGQGGGRNSAARPGASSPAPTVPGSQASRPGSAAGGSLHSSLQSCTCRLLVPCILPSHSSPSVRQL